MPIIAFDIGAITIRLHDTPAVSKASDHEQRSVLVSVYGEKTTKGTPEVLVDCIWLKSPFVVNDGTPIFHFEQVKSNCIMKEIYKINTNRGYIGQFRDDFCMHTHSPC